MAKADGEIVFSRACRSQRRTVREVLDGAAKYDALTALEAHAENCVHCGDALAKALNMRSLLDTLTESTASPADEDKFVAAVLSRIDVDVARVPQAGAHSAAYAPLRRVARAVTLTVVPTAAAALIISALIGSWPSPEEAVPPTRAVTVATAPAPRVSRPPLAQPAGVEVDFRKVHVASEDFRRAIESAAESLEFDSIQSVNAEPLIARLTETLGGSPRAAARAWLAEVAYEDAPAHAPKVDALAARVLGPDADFKDRRLLSMTLSRTGRAGRWAIAERGIIGIRELWRRAERDADARWVLSRIDGQLGFDTVALAPRNTGIELLAGVAAKSDAWDAAALLERFLESAETPWRDAWLGRPGAEAALERALPSHAATLPEKRLEALALALAEHPVTSGLPPLLEGMRHSEAAAEVSARTLALFADRSGAEALLGATRSQRLELHVEELAWRTMLAADAAALTSAVHEDRAYELGVDAALRQASVDGAPRLGTLTFLIQIAALDEAELTSRVRALLFVAAKNPDSIPDALREQLVRLLDQPPAIAAAAWLALGAHAPSSPSTVAGIVARGGSVEVMYLRLRKALNRRGAHDPI